MPSNNVLLPDGSVDGVLEVIVNVSCADYELFGRVVRYLGIIYLILDVEIQKDWFVVGQVVCRGAVFFGGMGGSVVEVCSVVYSMDIIVEWGLSQLIFCVNVCREVICCVQTSCA